MVQPLRTLSRGLDVLRVLNRNNGAGLRVVATTAKLSRGAVHRLLETMVAEGFVRKISGHYFVQPKVALLTAGVDAADWLTEETQAAIEDLCRAVMWPISISKPNKLGMEVCASTDHLTPLRYNMIPVGTKLPMLSSASGRIYLAFQPDDARERLIELLARDSEFPGDRESAQDSKAIAHLLDGIREKGWATAKAKNRTSIMTVPIIGDTGAAVGSLAVRYFSASLSDAEASARNLEKMRATATQLAARASVQTTH